MGCLKVTIRIIIIILAIIGGIALIQGNVNFNFREANAPKREVLIEQAKDFGDFSKLDSDYKLGKTRNILGYKKMTIYHTPSGQKTAFLHLKNSVKLTDFKNKKIDERITNFYSNFENTPIAYRDVVFTAHGTKIINKKETKYANFEITTINLPYKKIKGIVGAYEKDNKTYIYFSTKEAETFSYKINNDILDKLKI